MAAEKHRDARAGRVIGTARSNPRSRRDSLDLLLSARWIFRVDCIRAGEGGGRRNVDDFFFLLLIYRSIDPYSIFRGKICIVFLYSFVQKLLFLLFRNCYLKRLRRNSSPANMKRVMNRITSKRIDELFPSRDDGSRYSSTL